MDIVLFLGTPFFASLGLSFFTLLFLALVLGLATASVFVGIFYATHRLGKAAARRFDLGS